MKISIRKLVSFCPFELLSQFSFLVGSGISVPSGLPSGWTFNSSISHFLSYSFIEEKELNALMTTGYSVFESVIRFEQLIYILKERIDSELNILNCFDGECPTYLHKFLAYAISSESSVFTTNFDSLIELAFHQLTLKDGSEGFIQPVYAESFDEYIDSNGGLSFEQYLKKDTSCFNLFKLHGTLRDIRLPRSIDCKGIRESIEATLNKIGTHGGDLFLEQCKHKVLNIKLKDKFLVVIGYSGADDFDIIPSLKGLLIQLRGLIWIRHEETPLDIQQITPGNRLKLLPTSLITNTQLPKYTIVIRGRTEEIIKKLFKYHSHKEDKSSVLSIQEFLHSIEPYKDLTRIQKKIIIGRIAEDATKLNLASRKYLYVIRNRNKSDLGSLGYAMFRYGHLKRVMGEDHKAIRYQKKALKVFQNLEDLKSIALVKNALGNIYLQSGRLKKAEGFYDESLSIAKRLHFLNLESTILNNIGLIWKKRGLYDKALLYYHEALSIDNELNDKANIGRELGNILNILVLLKQNEKVISLSEEIISVQRLTGRTDIIANALISKGVSLVELGKIDDAKRIAHEALVLEERIGRVEGISRCISLFGRISYKEENYKKAILLFKKAISMQKSINRPEGEATDCQHLGDCYLKLRNHKKAKYYYQQSLQYYCIIVNKSKKTELKRMIISVSELTS